MTPFNLRETKLLIGSKEIKKRSASPFDELSSDFLNCLSQEIFKNKKSRKFNDLITFGFWCRKKNISNLSKQFKDSNIRKSLGIILHIPPGNVPITSLYSFVFGLLSGNSNIVRIANPKLENISLIIGILKKLINKRKFKEIKDSNAFIEYSKNDKVSAYLSSHTDGRIIWGGDNTIKIFKTYNTKPNCIDIFFSDKYSLSTLNSEKIIRLKENKMNDLIKNFYNDVFLMDQNACSSPHLVLWIGKLNKKGIDKFWTYLNKYIDKKYSLNYSISAKRYNLLNNYLLKNHNFIFEKKFNKIFVINIKDLDNNITKLRGFSGIFFQKRISSFDEIKFFLNRKIQTLTYFGISKHMIKKFLLSKNLEGIDRVVPIGQALDIGLIWDGFNIINKLTRIIDLK